MSKSTSSRILKPLSIFYGGVLLSGCGGEETIPLKKPDFIIEVPKEDAELKRAKPVPGSSAGMKPEQRPGQVK